MFSYNPKVYMVIEYSMLLTMDPPESVSYNHSLIAAK